MITIKCPECGAEYLPAEIYYPNDFFGSPANISKDKLGKIQFFTGKSMTTQETYVCDYCKRKMTVTATITFQAKVEEKPVPHITTFNRSNLILNEDD